MAEESDLQWNLEFNFIDIVMSWYLQDEVQPTLPAFPVRVVSATMW